MTTNKGLKIFLAVSTLFLIIVATVIVTLTLTIFKPKDPNISLHFLNLKNFELISPNESNLSFVFSIKNPNYGSFKYTSSTGYLKYCDTIVAEVPMEPKLFPARSKINVSASVGIRSGKLMLDPNFWSDIEDGKLNLTAAATLPGKVRMFKIFRLKATVYLSCDISFNVTSLDADSSCICKFKM